MFEQRKGCQIKLVGNGIEGRLGSTDMAIWNKACVRKQLWTVYCKSGSTWVTWVHEYVIRGRNFWHVPIPQHCTRCWKKILRLSMKLVTGGILSFGLTTGTLMALSWTISLDSINKSRLLLLLKVMGGIGLRLDQGPYRLLLQLLIVLLLLILCRQTLFFGFLQALASHVADTWEFLRHKQSKVGWHKLLWFPLYIPKDTG